MNFANALREYREGAGMTGEHLAGLPAGSEGGDE